MSEFDEVIIVALCIAQVFLHAIEVTQRFEIQSGEIVGHVRNQSGGTKVAEPKWSQRTDVTFVLAAFPRDQTLLFEF